MSHFPWNELGIAETRDQSAIRKAYSAKLKQLDLDNQIAEYESLREARDYALEIARAPEDTDDEDEFDDDFDDVDWDEDGVSFEIDGIDDFDAMLAELGLRDDDDVPLEYDSYRDLSSGWDSPPEEAETDAEMADAWKQLQRLVFPAGEQSDDGFTSDEFTAANAALAVLLDRASSGAISQSSAIDLNLSELMAAGWPRSGPLVEAANEEFHWLQDAGQLVERPALRFLNARIGGMRFQEEVQQPGHRYHDAWRDLEGGDAAPVWAKRWWLNRDKVFELLQIIRGQFPELEYLLDGERILKWENSTGSSFARIIQWIALFYFGLAALRFCAAETEPTVGDIVASDAATEIVNASVTDLFGYGWDRERVKQADPELEAKLTNAAMSGYFEDGDINEDGSKDLARRVMRQQMLAARTEAEFDDVLRIQQEYQVWLRAARDAGGDACRQALSWEDLTHGDPQSVSTEIRRREQALMRDLLEKGLLSEDISTGPRNSAIPGWVIGEVIESTGISDDAVRKALGNDDDSNRCSVMIGLLEAVARSPGRVDSDLLTFP